MMISCWVTSQTGDGNLWNISTNNDIIDQWFSFLWSKVQLSDVLSLFVLRFFDWIQLWLSGQKLYELLFQGLMAFFSRCPALILSTVLSSLVQAQTHCRVTSRLCSVLSHFAICFLCKFCFKFEKLLYCFKFENWYNNLTFYQKKWCGNLLTNSQYEKGCTCCLILAITTTR